MLSAQYYVFDLHLYVVVCAILVYLDSIHLFFVSLGDKYTTPSTALLQVKLARAQLFWGSFRCVSTGKTGPHPTIKILNGASRLRLGIPP